MSRRAISANGRSGHGNSAHGGPGIPEATIARLPVYLRVLYAFAEQDIPTVSSEELAAAAGVNSAKLRKDLSHLGSYGTRGVGYDVEYLVYQVSRELGLTQDWPVVIVGAGNLGRALANYGGFASRGFRIAAVLDSDPDVVGTQIAGHGVLDVEQMEQVVARHRVSIGVIATPAGTAQAVCDRLVATGVTSILNFAPVVPTMCHQWRRRAAGRPVHPVADPRLPRAAGFPDVGGGPPGRCPPPRGGRRPFSPPPPPPPPPPPLDECSRGRPEPQKSAPRSRSWSGRSSAATRSASSSRDVYTGPERGRARSSVTPATGWRSTPRWSSSTAA